jgi:hypothetical protein
MEYLMTYGWAILVVLIVGIVVWEMGLFDFESRITPGYSGFSVLVPADWGMSKGAPDCSFSVLFENGAGEEIRSIQVADGSSCTPSSVGAGGDSLCRISGISCGSAGKAYNREMSVMYMRSSDNMSFQSSGTLWGNIE